MLCDKTTQSLVPQDVYYHTSSVKSVMYNTRLVGNAAEANLTFLQS